ncbi:hypothetical protein ACFQS7_19440 [Dankookia sp. GCM10030260]|uniref:hypothetical protein n=1 Tax=Dankookia sp. GCM10030260 TaxID=3273390 RepID=UPI0036218853
MTIGKSRPAARLALLLLSTCAPQDVPAANPPGGTAAETLAGILSGRHGSGAIAGAALGAVTGQASLATRGGEITVSHPVAPSGYGLHVHILPGRMVDDSTLGEIARFHCARLLSAGPGGVLSQAAKDRPATALFVLPTRLDMPRGTSRYIDVALAHELLRQRVPQPNMTRVHVVATAQPLGAGEPQVTDKVIQLQGMAPPFVTTWLLRLAQSIEDGRIDAPETLDLRLRSVFWQVGAAGSRVGIKPAAATPGPACSAR